MLNKKERERLAGSLFIGQYNKARHKSWVLENEEQIKERGEDPVPDLIFYDGKTVLEVEELSLWDNADIKAKMGIVKNGIGTGQVCVTEQLYFCDLIKENILKKNYKCDILLINAYINRWEEDLELKGFDVFSQNDFDLQNHFREFYREVWLLDCNRNIKQIYSE